LVEPQPRHKPEASEVRHRLNMVWLALRDQSKMELLPLEHQNFSVAETLPWLEKRFSDAELYMLMGSDAFKKLPRWPGFDSLQVRVHFVVGQRQNDDTTPIPIKHTAVRSELGDLASCLVRAATAAEQAIHLPPLVHKYVLAENLYQEGSESASTSAAS
jgi:nicotinate (nicotinamide) nucleotide adenylyltransferase